MQAVFLRWPHDQKSTWVFENLGLGSVQTWNTHESKSEVLPLSVGYAGNRVVFTGDVRIDNRDDLISRLRLDSKPGLTTDAEVIVAAYYKWGERCPEYLIGDFSFLLWDERKRSLFCARDLSGIKQFYYHRSSNYIVFSNNLEAILESGLVPRDLDSEVVALYYLSSTYSHPEKTKFSSVKKLPPACRLTADVNGSRVGTYWRPEEVEAVRFATFDRYVERFRELLDDSVRCRMRTSYGLVTHLTGGLDSSAITATVAQSGSFDRSRLSSFNWALPASSDMERKCPDWQLANYVAEENSISHVSLPVAAEQVTSNLLSTNSLLNYDSVFWEESIVRDEAEKRGARTILSGWGGDELCSYAGGSLYSMLIRRGDYGKVIRSIRDVGFFRNQGFLRECGYFLYSLVYGYLYKYLDGPYCRSTGGVNVDHLTRDFADLVRGCSIPELKFDFGEHGEQLAFYQAGHLVSRIENWSASGAAHGIEYRYPLLDKRIVEFCLGVPDELYLPAKGQARYLFRSAVSDRLPESVLSAGKYSDQASYGKRKKLWRKSLEHLLMSNSSIFTFENEYVDMQALKKNAELALLSDFENELASDWHISIENALSLAVSLRLID